MQRQNDDENKYKDKPVITESVEGRRIQFDMGASTHTWADAQELTNDDFPDGEYFGSIMG